MVKTKPNKTSFKKGNVPWNLGKKISLNIDLIVGKYYKEKKSTIDIGKEFNVRPAVITKKLKEEGYKLRENGFKKGNKTKTQFKKGHKGYTYWKGKSRSEETKEKIRIKSKGKHNSKETEFKKGVKVSKSKEWIKNQAESLKKFYQTKEGIKRRKEISKRIKISRAKQIFPLKDSSIEVKIQNFLKQLGITFFTHQHIGEIEHSYQCDIFIPSKNLVIECDGDYFHKYPIGNELDHVRTDELLKKGFKVLRLWEQEIKYMDINKFWSKLSKS